MMPSCSRSCAICVGSSPTSIRFRADEALAPQHAGEFAFTVKKRASKTKSASRARRAVDLVREEAALDARSRVGDDAELFEELRDLRRELADEHQVPALLRSPITRRACGRCRHSIASWSSRWIIVRRRRPLWAFAGTINGPRGKCFRRARRAVDLVREEAALDARSRVGDDAELFEELRDLRRELADEHQVPAYIICSDATLRGMCRKRPATREELLDVPGIGEKKADAYGAAFLAAIADYEASVR